MFQLLQIAGALLILGGFILAQANRVTVRSLPYLAVNTLGAGVLAGLALHERQWGFLLLEGTWTAVSAVSLARRLLGDAPRS